MKTIQIAIDDTLLQKIDLAAQFKKIARSQFIRQALENAVHQQMILDLEQKQIEGYLKHPLTGEEFNVWDLEQVWE